MTQIENTFLPIYNAWEKTQGGVISSNNIPADILDKYTLFMNELKALDGQKVTLQFIFQQDFIGGSGEKTGKVIVEDGKVKFYEGRKTTRFYYLDAGIFSGWRATVIPIKITPLDSPKKKVIARFENEIYTLTNMKGDEICGFSELARMEMYCKKRSLNLINVTGI